MPICLKLLKVLIKQQSVMWLVKKAANKVYSMGQNVLREQSEGQKLINDIISNADEVMPIRKMSDLAQHSYKMEEFEIIVSAITNKLMEIKFERKSLKRRLNLLVLSAYLIKHGAGGFIDQFRAILHQFDRYENMVNFVAEKDEEKSSIMQEIRERAKYIRVLLTDKAALLRQKEVGRLIKQKLFLQSNGGDYSSLRREAQKKEGQSKVDEFLQHYVWRYTQKIDKKLDQITDILITKIDQYLDGQIPENFQIDQAQITTMKPSVTRSEFQLGGEVTKKEEVRFIESKLKYEPAIKEEDLLDLPKAKDVDLLVFNEQGSEMKENSIGQSNKIQVALPKQTQLDDDEIQMFRNQLKQQTKV